MQNCQKCPKTNWGYLGYGLNRIWGDLNKLLKEAKTKNGLILD